MCRAEANSDNPLTETIRVESDAREIVTLPGGRFSMGTNDRILPLDGEYPARPVRIKPFRIDRFAVTNGRFSRFADQTGYISEAEDFGWSAVFFGFLEEAGRYEYLPGAEWWRRVDGACWHSPEGPGSDLSGRMNHPVVHVSWNDACAFARWAGGRLPNEKEWEFAARGGLEATRFPWGDEEPDDTHFLPCNIWQGQFPTQNTAADGYVGTAPVDSYSPNGYGLYNMIGNTWEWLADRFRIRSVSPKARAVNKRFEGKPWHVLKGGSFLCHKSYCYRYRIAARTANTPDSTTNHMGFRLAYDD